MCHVADSGRAVVDGRRGDVDQAPNTRVASGPGDDRRPLDPDPVLVLTVGPHRVHRRDNGARALDHGGGEIRLEEVADPLVDAVESRRRSGTPHDGTYGRSPPEQRRTRTGADEAVGSGDHDDGPTVG